MKKASVKKTCECGSLYVNKCKSCSLRKAHARGAKFGHKHGLRHHYLYRTVSRVKERCYNPNHVKYDNYGGRGIGMLPEWRDDVTAFLKWIIENLGDRPEGHTLDRIDGDKGYYPNNLRWADDTTQNRNRRGTSYHKLTKLVEEN